MLAFEWWGISGENMQFNIGLIPSKGGNLCGEDKLSVQACSECQGQYRFNKELNDVYYHAEELSRHFFKIPGLDLPPCRYCGALHWQFSATAPDQQQVQIGAWAWVFKSRVFTFDD